MPTIKTSNPQMNTYVQSQLAKNSPLSYDPQMSNPVTNYQDQLALANFRNQGITYEDLAELLYGNR